MNELLTHEFRTEAYERFAALTESSQHCRPSRMNKRGEGNARGVLSELDLASTGASSERLLLMVSIVIDMYIFNQSLYPCFQLTS